MHEQVHRVHQLRRWRHLAHEGHLREQRQWDYLGGPLGINSTGAISFDPNDVTRRTIYAGTGEANICGSGCLAGSGLYKSTDEGEHWTRIGNAEFTGKGIGEIVVKPGDSNTIYAATTTALRGYSSSCCTGVTRPVPGITKWGLYKTTNGGATWSFIHNGSINAADCTGSIAEFNNTGIARRAAFATSSSTRRTRASSTRPRMHEVSGARTTPEPRGRRSSRL